VALLGLKNGRAESGSLVKTLNQKLIVTNELLFKYFIMRLP